MRSASVSTSALFVALGVCACESTAPPARPLAHGGAGAVPAASIARPAASSSARAPAPAVASDAGQARERPPEPPPAWPELAAGSDTHDFCPKRLRALDVDACFVVPAKPVTTLLIYLHGIVPPTRDSVQKTNLAEVVANSSERADIVALLPRGEQGFAPAKYPRWWGWPTSKVAYERHADTFIRKLRDKRAQLERLLGVTFERTYLAGSSSGAYFVASVLLHGHMPEVAGYAVLSGGSGYDTPELAALPRAPVYVGFGQHDAVGGPARALGTRLEGLGWPVKVAAHPTGHGAREVYLDEAISFWQQHQR